MTVGIVGSGFGLYGYLPALAVGLNQAVMMPRRYRAKLLARPDVRTLDDRVTWVDGEDELLARATALVIAQRPVDQVALVTRALRYPQIARFLLEKPLAPTPEQAGVMLDALEVHGKHVRLGFSFRYCQWAHDVADWMLRAGPQGRVAVTWTFRAHHYAHALETWKRHPSYGGGALRFFGIHLIGLFSELGYRNAVGSRLRAEGPDDVSAWTGHLTGSELPPCSIAVDSAANAARFSIRGDSGTDALQIDLPDPFPWPAATAVQDGFDRRVAVLTPLCRAFLVDPDPAPAWHRASVRLWQAVEDAGSWNDAMPIPAW